MRAIIASLILIASIGAASAQTGSDCSYGTFTLRSYPAKIVQLEVQSRSSDPLNTFVQSALARCDDTQGHRVLICGSSARRSRTGYLDNPRLFYGVYSVDITNSRDPARFKITHMDQAATGPCKKFHSSR